MNILAIVGKDCMYKNEWETGELVIHINDAYEACFES